MAPRRTLANDSCCLARATAKSSGLQPLRRPSMEFKTAEAQRDELLQRARRKGLPVRTGQRRAMAEPAWLHDADLAAQKYSEAVVVAVEKCARDTAGRGCYICKGYTGTLVRGCACRGTAGFAHVSCLAYQARSLVEFGVDNRLGDASLQARFDRWSTCRLCERDYHGVVACALGWACWKTYVGRPEADRFRRLAMHVLLSGLCEAEEYEDALSVGEAQLSTLRRVGVIGENILVAQGALAVLYQNVGRNEEALHLRRDVYSRYLRLYGEEHEKTLRAANRYASSLIDLQRFKEAKSLFRKAIPVARRVLGEGDEITLRMGALYAMASRGDAVAGDRPERAAAGAWTPADEEELAALRRKAARRAREEAARREREEAAERQREEAAAARRRRQEAAATKAQEAAKRRTEARPPAGMTGLEMQSWQRRAIDRILDIDAEKEPDMILGVRWGAPKHEVKKAYKALAILFHPDKCSAPDASNPMKKINTARQKLFVAATSERECAPPPPPPPSTPPPQSSPPRPT